MKGIDALPKVYNGLWLALVNMREVSVGKYCHETYFNDDKFSFIIKHNLI